LRFREKVFGVIQVVDEEAGRFTEADLRMLEPLAGSAAIAIENARLHEQAQQEIVQRRWVEGTLQQRADVLEELQATLLDITAAHDLPTLLETIVERATSLLVASGGGMYLTDPEREEARCVVSHNVPQDYRGTVLKYGEGAAGTVAQTGEPLIIDDYRAWSGRAAVYEEDQPFAAVLSVPMVWEDEVIGVIHVLRDEEGERFATTDLELLTLFGNHAAIAVENTRLRDELQRELVEREQIERQIEERRVYLESVLACAPDAIATIDAQSRVLEWNPGAERLFGYSREEALGQNIDELVTGPDAEMWEEALRFTRQVHEGQSIPPTETVRYRKGGMPVDVVMACSPILVQDEMVGDVVVYSDISEWKRTERQLRESEERYRTLSAATFEGIALTERGVVIDLNQQMADMLRYGVQEMIGMDVRQMVAPEDRELVHEKIMAGMEEPYDHQALCKDGTVIHVEVRPRMMTLGERAVRVTAIRDITERKRMEQQLTDSLREKEVLLKEIHHRVKNNMQLVSGLLDLQSEFVSDPEVLRALRDSQGRVRSMALVHERLYQSGDLARVDFGEYVRGVAESLFLAYGDTSAEVDLKIAVGDVLLGIDRAVPCGLLVSELISNSLQHAFPADRSGEIRVSLDPVGDDKLMLAVSDNGVGLPPELGLEHPQSLGLQLVRMLVDQLQGQVELDRDGGTTVKVTFAAGGAPARVGDE
jgi:PAS domain S-box-containing protein